MSQITGICLIAAGIVMRDTACSIEEVTEKYIDRYAKLIEKKGSSANITTEQAKDLSKTNINELLSRG